MASIVSRAFLSSMRRFATLAFAPRQRDRVLGANLMASSPFWVGRLSPSYMTGTCGKVSGAAHRKLPATRRP